MIAGVVVSKSMGIREVTCGSRVSTSRTHGKTALGRGVSRTGAGRGMTPLSLPRENIVTTLVLEAKSMGIGEMT